MKLIILLIILLLSFNFEKFTPIFSSNNTTFLNNEYCLMTKTITPKGGIYLSKIKKGLPKNNSFFHTKFFNDDFTKEDCLNKNFGSGRKRGGYECKDFITQKEAKKYNLEFSYKTCYDKLPFTPKIIPRTIGSVPS